MLTETSTLKAVSVAPPMRMGRMLRQSFVAMSPQEKFRVVGMYATILALHAIGFLVFVAFVVPSHYKGLGIGIAVTAYTLGLRCRPHFGDR
jgi:high-affinity nickel permease